MPLAATIAILANTAPPPSLTFFRYICTFVSTSGPSRTGLPCFCKESTVMSPPLGSPLLFCRISSTYAVLIDRMVVSRTVLFSFLEKNLAAAATPCWEEYLPMSARSPGLYRWYAPRFPFSLTWTSFSVAACTSWFARAIAWGGIVDESDPFGSGSPSLRCRYRSRTISPTRSCSCNCASLLSWLKIFCVGNFCGVSQPWKYLAMKQNFPNYSISVTSAILT